MIAVPIELRKNCAKEMKLLLLTPLVTTLVTTAVLSAPVIAQTATETTTVPVDSQEPPTLVNDSGTVMEKTDGSETGAASADSDRADRLPIPFTDLSPEHWAFEAVINLYY